MLIADKQFADIFAGWEHRGSAQFIPVAPRSNRICSSRFKQKEKPSNEVNNHT